VEEQDRKIGVLALAWSLHFTKTVDDIEECS
jgi:hypothetical protein